MTQKKKEKKDNASPIFYGLATCTHSQPVGAGAEDGAGVEISIPGTAIGGAAAVSHPSPDATANNNRLREKEIPLAYMETTGESFK